MPDYKKLCAELLLFAEEAGEICTCEGLWPVKCDPNYALLDRARAALAEPEPDPEEVKKWLLTNCARVWPPAPYQTWNEWAEAVVSAKVIQGVHIKAFNPSLPAAAPTEPEPEGPTDDELNALWNCCGIADEYGHHEGNFFEFARAVLARWGNRSAPQPIPIADELEAQ